MKKVTPESSCLRWPLSSSHFLGDEVEEIIEDDRDLLLPAERPLHEIRDNLRQDRHRICRPSTLRSPRRREEGNEEGDT